MLLSLPANPVPSELYQYFRGSPKIWLPWYIWGGGVYATKYNYDTSKYIGYFGTVSVPLEAGSGSTVKINSLRMIGAVEGKTGSTEGAPGHGQLVSAYRQHLFVYSNHPDRPQSNLRE